MSTFQTNTLLVDDRKILPSNEANEENKQNNRKIYVSQSYFEYEVFNEIIR